MLERERANRKILITFFFLKANELMLAQKNAKRKSGSHWFLEGERISSTDAQERAHGQKNLDHIFFIEGERIDARSKNCEQKNLDHIAEIARVSRRSAVDEKRERKMPMMRDRAYRKSGPEWSASARVPVRKKMIGCSLGKGKRSFGRERAGSSMNRPSPASPAFR